MFTQKSRLTRPEIEGLVKSGKRLSGPYFDVVYKGAPSFKIAISVSKKTAKTAVERHKIRRRMFAALRAGALPEAHLFILAKKQALTVNYQDIYTSMESLVSQIRAKKV